MLFLGFAIVRILGTDGFDIDVFYGQVRDENFHFRLGFIFSDVIDRGILKVSVLYFSAKDVVLEDDLFLLHFAIDFVACLFCFVFFNKFPGFG